MNNSSYAMYAMIMALAVLDIIAGFLHVLPQGTTEAVFLSIASFFAGIHVIPPQLANSVTVTSSPLVSPGSTKP